MQRSWNKHGEQSFRVELIERAQSNELAEVEQQYLDEHLGKPNCFNIGKDADCPFRGVPHSSDCSHCIVVRNYKPSLAATLTLSKATEASWKNPKVWERRARGIRKSWKTLSRSRLRQIELMVGSGNPFYGKKHTKETLQTIRAARANQVNVPQKKLTQPQIDEIRGLSMKQRDLAKKYGVSQRTIWNVLHRSETYRNT